MGKQKGDAQNASLLMIMVPTAGLEPARVSPPPPQDGVSTNSTTSASRLADQYLLLSYHLAGAGATGTGAAGATGAGCSTGAGWDVRTGNDLLLLYMIAKTRLVNINRTTATVVIRVMNPEVPELPKSV
jgi:hypothetical protein